MCQLPLELADRSYIENNMEVYTSECTKNHVCKLFALTDGAVTRDMSAMPLEKLKNILSNNRVSKKTKYLLKYIWSN